VHDGSDSAEGPLDRDGTDAGPVRVHLVTSGAAFPAGEEAEACDALEHGLLAGGAAAEAGQGGHAVGGLIEVEAEFRGPLRVHDGVEGPPFERLGDRHVTGDGDAAVGAGSVGVAVEVQVLAGPVLAVEPGVGLHYLTAEAGKEPGLQPADGAAMAGQDAAVAQGREGQHRWSGALGIKRDRRAWCSSRRGSPPRRRRLIPR
jgi:hypothetical protein